MIISPEFLKEVKDFCGESSTDSDIITLITSLMNAADETLKGSIGTDYPVTSERAKLLIKVIVNDFYTNRDYMESSKVSSNTRRLIDSMTLQLQMEARAIAETVVTP